MKYLIILAVAALAFAGCSAGATIGDDDDAMLPQDSTVAATAVEDVAE